MLYVYAFLPTPSVETLAVLDTIAGFQSPIQILNPSQSPIAAAVEPLAGFDELSTTDESLLRSALRHDRVICELFNHLHVLPLQFGTCVLSSDRLQQHLRDRHQDYLNTLASIEGKSEYRLTAVVNDATDLSHPQREHPEQELQPLMTQLVSTWPAWAGSRQDDEYLRSYFLLSANEYNRALTITDQWSQHNGHWRLAWSTALPPYHFV